MQFSRFAKTSASIDHNQPVDVCRRQSVNSSGDPAERTVAFSVDNS